MSSAGYKAALMLSGASTEALDEPCTELTTTVYQITSTAKRVIDPAVEVVVYEDDVEVPASGYTINYLYGKITFGVAPSGVITADVNYLPLTEACSVRGVTFAITRESLDVTTFCTVDSDGPNRRSLLGLRMVEVSGDTVDPSSDTSRGDFESLINQTTDIPAVMEYWPDRTNAASYRVRGFVSSLEDTADVQGLVTSNFSFSASQYIGGGAVARSQD
jgi:hypothetical protein